MAKSRLTKEDRDLVEDYYHKARSFIPDCPATALAFYDDDSGGFGYSEAYTYLTAIVVNQYAAPKDGGSPAAHFSAIIMLHELGHVCLNYDPRFVIPNFQDEYDKREDLYLELEAAADAFAQDMVMKHFADDQPLRDALKAYLGTRAYIFLPDTKPCDRP